MAFNRGKPAELSDADIAQTLGVNQSKGWRKYFLKLGSMIVIIIVITLVVMKLPGNNDLQNVHYKMSKVIRGELIVTVTATGTLEPVNQVEVGSEISGTIKTVLVDFNDRINKDQILARMDVDRLMAEVNQAQASLELAKAEVKATEATVVETRNKLRRAKELAKSGMCSEEVCDAAQASFDRAVADLARNKARVVQAQASLEAEQTTLAKATIHSPISGIVLMRDVEPGQTVAASFQTPVLFTIAENLTQMELHVDVDEADVGQVLKGQKAEFTVDAYPDKIFPARIMDVHFASQAIDGVVTYETILSVDNSDLLLRPGMTATAEIIVKQVKDVLLVPNAALRFTPPEQEGDASKGSKGLLGSLLPRPPGTSKQQDKLNADKNQQQVWVLRNGQLFAIPVTTQASNGIMTEIIDGSDIKPGLELIIDSVNRG